FSRNGNVASPATASAPWNTWVNLPVPSTSMMPTPVRWLPGSMPRILTDRDSGFGIRDSGKATAPSLMGPAALRFDRIPYPESRIPTPCSRQHGVVRYVADVVQRVELLEQIEQGFLRFLGHRHAVVRAHHHASVRGIQTRV